MNNTYESAKKFHLSRNICRSKNIVPLVKRKYKLISTNIRNEINKIQAIDVLFLANDKRNNISRKIGRLRTGETKRVVSSNDIGMNVYSCNAISLHKKRREKPKKRKKESQRLFFTKSKIKEASLLKRKRIFSGSSLKIRKSSQEAKIR